MKKQPSTSVKATKHKRSHQRRTARTCDLCPVFGRCGGCDCLDVPYKKQLAQKQAFIEDLFCERAPYAVCSSIKGMDNPFHYRHKVVSPYACAHKQGRKNRSEHARVEVLTGMYERGTHKLIPTTTCMLEDKTAKAVTLAVAELMRKWNIAPYNEDTQTGFMRHCVVRVGHESGEVLVVLVTNSEQFPSSKSFCRALVARVPEITTVVQSINTRATNVILGNEERVLYGPGFILDTLCGLSFRISAHSFYQVNATQTEVLYRCAVDLAKLDGSQVLIDAYCGTGTIGLVAASSGARGVVGIDAVEDAIVDARQNARHNGVKNASFIHGDAEAVMRDMAQNPARYRDVVEFGDSREDASQAPLVIIMDPPRAGSTDAFLHAATSLKPERIVYISCNPTTQARDVDTLRTCGYEVEAIVPVDMFPHTSHVECVVSCVPAYTLEGHGAVYS